MATLEIAVFTAKNPDDFAGRQQAVHDTLGNAFPGHVASLGLRNVAEPSIYADLVLWKDLAAAKVAAAGLADVEELAWFHDELGEIRFFDHFETALDAESLARIGSAAAIELVLLLPAELDVCVEAHMALHAKLEDVEAVGTTTRLAPNDNGIIGDVNAWIDPTAAEAVAGSMMRNPALAPVFDERNEMMVFMHGTRNASR